MNKKLTILIILLSHYQLFSQVVKFDSIQDIPYSSGVAMPLQTYRYIRTKTINCDTLIKINEQILNSKDSILSKMEKTLVNERNNRKSYEIELKQKNNTITKLDSISNNMNKEMLKMEYKMPFFKRKTTYYAFLVGFIIPLLLK